MAEGGVSATDDLPCRRRSSSFPFMVPDLSKEEELVKTRSSMRLQPSLSQMKVDSSLQSPGSSEHIRPDLTLFLCGRRGTTKTLAAKAILGRTELYSSLLTPGGVKTSEYVKHQGETCGRWVSLLEFPALYGKPHEVALEESFSSLSCCDPEGVHAFVLVLPVGPLTDEDKGELKTIQDTFYSGVNDFTMILFTVDSDPTDPAVVDFVKESRDIQELCQSCGGRKFIFNIEDKQQISEMLDAVEKMAGDGSRSFTKDMFTSAQMRKVVEQEKVNARLKAELQDVRQRSRSEGGDGIEPLRVVLIGRTGSGKGSTANTIIGKKHFTPRVNPKPPATSCEEAIGEIDGRPVVVVNTPGLFDTTQMELLTSIRMLAPGPHVFLLVLPIGNFTREEEDSVMLIKTVFGEKAGDFTIIVFTRGEELEDQSIESYIENCDFVKQLVEECGRRYQVFNNKDETRHTQVRELLTKIENMLTENASSYYKIEMPDETEEFNLTRSNTDLRRIPKEVIEEMRRKEGEIRILKRTIEHHRQETEYERRQRAKQEQRLQKEQEERAKEHHEERKRRIQEDVRRQEWRKKLEVSENRAKLERDEKERALRNLDQCRKTMKREQEAWEKERREYLAKNRAWRN